MLTATISALITPTVEARGTGAILGTPADGAQRNCFAEVFGGIRNVCDHAASWVMPLLLDGHSWTNAVVHARGVRDTARGVGCQFWAVFDHTLDRVQFASLASTTRRTGVDEELWGTIHIAGAPWYGNREYRGYAGAFYMFCTLDPGTEVMSLHYTNR